MMSSILAQRESLAMWLDKLNEDNKEIIAVTVTNFVEVSSDVLERKATEFLIIYKDKADDIRTGSGEPTREAINTGGSSRLSGDTSRTTISRSKRKRIRLTAKGSRNK